MGLGGVGGGTECKQNEPLKKYRFVMSNLQLNPKRVENHTLCFNDLAFC
jgi:hypothetical protein